MTWRDMTWRAVALGGAIVIVGCGDDANDGAWSVAMPDPAATVAGAANVAPASSLVEPTGEVTRVIALDNSFRPDRVEIAVGGEVRWENRGLNDHDVLSIQRDEWGVEAEGFVPGAVYAHVFDQPGAYRYFCSIHGTESFGMTGTIVVTP